MNAIATLATAAEAAAGELFGQLRSQSSEAEALALEMIQAGQARLRFDMVLTGQPSIRLLLDPSDCEGDPVEIAVLGAAPVAPSAEALVSRIWFFGRLAHWSPKH